MLNSFQNTFFFTFIYFKAVIHTDFPQLNCPSLLCERIYGYEFVYNWTRMAIFLSFGDVIAVSFPDTLLYFIFIIV